MSSDNLAEIRKRADSATPGPWRMWNPSEGPSHLVVDGKIAWLSAVSASGFGDDETIPHWSDANFIAHAREDIPRLLDLIVEQRATIAPLETELERQHHTPSEDRARLEADLHVSEEQVDDLATVIAEAPHGVMCDTHAAKECDCWKSKVPTQSQNERRPE